MSKKNRASIAVIGLLGVASLSYGGLTDTLKHLGSAAAPSAQSAKASAADDQVLQHAANAFNEVASKSLPAVVSISSIRRMTQEDASQMDPMDHSMAKMFGQQDPRMMGLGSGMMIRPDGYILTNNHVVENAERITVSFDEKTKFNARIVGTDPKTDLAVIRLESSRKDYPTLNFGNSDQLQVGDWAIAIGSPFGLTQSVSFGIISAKGRGHMGILDTEDFIQTDAAINPGSSGGPLLNSKGEVIGVNTAIFSQGGGFMGIGFAVPAKIAKEIATDLIADGRVKRGWVGLVAQDVSPELAKYFKSPKKEGALVSEIVPGSPAATADIQQGDVLLKYNHQPIADATQLKALVGHEKSGNEVPIELSRRGEVKNLTLKVREAPQPPRASAPQLAGRAAGSSRPSGPRFGIAVDDVPQEVASYLKLKSTQGAMVIGVSPGSPAYEAGLAPGDVILSANDAQVRNAREFAQVMKKAKENDISVLYVQRGPEERIFVPLKGKV